MNFINIHTHHQPRGQEQAIINLYSDFEKANENPLCSCGLHPWYLKEETLDAEFKALKDVAVLKNVVVIGECGLDRLSTTDWDLQQKAFILQLELAKEVQKPVIIHCVRAFDEVVSLVKKQSLNQPVIFHGFNKKEELAERLIAEGFYLSFGKAILNEESSAAKSLAAIPAEKFFLETDDELIPVKDVYNAAARIRKTGLDEIILQVQKNFQTVFAR